MTNNTLTQSDMSLIWRFKLSWGFWPDFLLFVFICVIILQVTHTQHRLSLHTPARRSSADRSKTRTQEPYTVKNRTTHKNNVKYSMSYTYGINPLSRLMFSQLQFISCISQGCSTAYRVTKEMSTSTTTEHLCDISSNKPQTVCRRWKPSTQYLIE